MEQVDPIRNVHGTVVVRIDEGGVATIGGASVSAGEIPRDASEEMPQKAYAV